MTSCGIDFGTSNSAVAITQNNAVRLARVEGDSLTMPSAIFYHADGTPAYGRDAVKSFFEGDDGRFMRSFKRTLGTELIEYGAIINGKLKKYDQIIAGFIRRIKTSAEKDLGANIDSVVMGRPVHFVDGNNNADNKAQSELEEIAHLVGFKNVEFQFEPIAAAFAHERSITGERLSLVVDIGGGTSDFTIIRLSKDAADKIERKDDILASSGTRIGGNDFDRDFCLQSFMPPLGYKTTYGSKNMQVPLGPFHDMAEWSKVNFLYVPKMRKELRALYLQSHDQKTFGRFVKAVETEIGYKILSMVEESKINLTIEETYLADMNFLEDDFNIPVNRQLFNAAVNHHVTGISANISECLNQAGIADDAIELVILTGGTTEVPLLQETIKQRFPNAEISEENKLSSVGLGLGYDSLRRFGDKIFL